MVVVAVFAACAGSTPAATMRLPGCCAQSNRRRAQAVDHVTSDQRSARPHCAPLIPGFGGPCRNRSTHFGALLGGNSA